MTTKQAFKTMIYTPSVWRILGIPQQRVLYFRYRIKHNLPLNTDKMEELLIKFGYTVKQEKLWDKP
jgi:hypothetical protein